MLTPTIELRQGQQQQQPVSTSQHSLRRVSCETIIPPSGSGMINGAFVNRQQSAPQAPAVGQPRAPIMQWQHQPQRPQGFGQTPQHHQMATRHSFASSMDLISPAVAASAPNNTNTSFFQKYQPQQNHLFKSSSHHTSHTAAAGDLLTMSRKALHPPPLNHSLTKKRSSTDVDMTAVAVGSGSSASRHPFPFTNLNRSNSQPSNAMQFKPQHQQVVNTQQGNVPQHMMMPPMDPQGVQMVGGSFPMSPQQQDYKAPPLFGTTQSVANISMSTIVTTSGDNSDESYSQHRARRICRRSDSFEMDAMEDC